MAMRVTIHFGRTHTDGSPFNPLHNDRSYDAFAFNIDTKKSKNNVYWTWDEGFNKTKKGKVITPYKNYSVSNLDDVL